jgi:hypothetical protein
MDAHTYNISLFFLLVNPIKLKFKEKRRRGTFLYKRDRE